MAVELSIQELCKEPISKFWALLEDGGRTERGSKLWHLILASNRYLHRLTVDKRVFLLRLLLGILIITLENNWLKFADYLRLLFVYTRVSVELHAYTCSMLCHFLVIGMDPRLCGLLVPRRALIVLRT